MPKHLLLTARRAVRRTIFRPALQSGSRGGLRPLGASTFALLCAALMGLALAGCGYTPGFNRMTNYAPPPNQIPHTKFISANDCKTCHPSEYDQWRTAMHAYAQTSPIFQAFDVRMEQDTGGSIGTFCARCHSPIGVSQGDSALLPNDQRSDVAMQAVTCIVCHGTNLHNGQASAQFRVPLPGQKQPVIYGPFYGHDEPGAPNDPALRLIPSPHVSRYSSLMTNSRLCAQCHDVLGPDNSRLEEAFSEWRNSPYAARGITCQDCHMSPDPGKDVPFVRAPIVDTDLFPNAPARPRSSHTFTGPDYSVIAAFGQSDLGLDSKEFAEHTKLLEQQREQLIRNAATMVVSNPSVISPGQTMHVSVAITNTGAGHNFPTGFAVERQVWLEIVATDASGEEFFTTGLLDKYRDLLDDQSEQVEDGEMPRDWNLFNLQAMFIVHNFKGTESEYISTVNRQLTPVPFVNPAAVASTLTGFPPSVDRIFKRGIPPLKTRTANYRIKVPSGATGPIMLSVRLRYRNLPPHLLRDLGIPALRSKLRIMDVATYKARIALR